MFVAMAGAWVRFAVGPSCHWMSLGMAFALIGFFLWVAENAAAYVGAWSYPHQLGGWQPVPLTKFGAWALLISVTFVLVARSRGTPDQRGRVALDEVTGSAAGKGGVQWVVQETDRASRVRRPPAPLSTVTGSAVAPRAPWRRLLKWRDEHSMV